MRQVDLNLALRDDNSYPTVDGSVNGGGHNQPGQPAATFDGSDGIVVIRYLE